MWRIWEQIFQSLWNTLEHFGGGGVGQLEDFIVSQ